MSAPPLVARLQVYDEERDFDVWLPLFLAWIILLAFAIALSPIAIFLILVLWPTGWGKFLLLLPVNVYRCVRDLKDLRIDVKNERRSVLIYFK